MVRVIGGDGVEYGPVSAEQLRQWSAEGRTNSRTDRSGDLAAALESSRKPRTWCGWAFIPSAVAIGLYLLVAFIGIVVGGGAR